MPMGWRGARVAGEIFPAYEYDTQVDLAAIGMVAVVVGLLALARRRLRLSWAFLIGQCFAPWRR